ncbi:hypothetical protein V5G65_12490 [Mammaliicoccus sciuri]|uniref:hypothetical protein n=1 Tax=Mammaliicoccus sciuri TaxID=1296 RepID=UPI0037991668
MKFNEFKDAVTFFGKTKHGPEAYDTENEEIYKCRCTLYDPSEKDFKLGDLNLNATSVTLIIRRVPERVALKTSSYFIVNTGFYKEKLFNIKHLSVINQSYMKIVGESSWE